jgi:hypothetical protein
MAKQSSGGTPRAALMDMAGALKKVFHKYSREARKQAWKKLTHGEGEKMVGYMLDHPDRSLNPFQRITFHEWLETKR